MAERQNLRELERSLNLGLVFLSCEFCCRPGRNNGQPEDPAGKLPEALYNFVCFRASCKQWDIVEELCMMYMSSKLVLPLILVKFCLNVMDGIADSKTFPLMETVLEKHLALHPPCRPNMHKYYYKVFVKPLSSQIFDHQHVAGGFLHLLRKLEVSFRELEEFPPALGQVAPTTAKTMAMPTLMCASSSNNRRLDGNPDQLKLNIQLFMLRYSIDILVHDFISRSKTCDPDNNFEQWPLVSKILYGRYGVLGSINVEFEWIFRLYFKTPKNYYEDVARLVVLLGETIRYHTICLREWPYWGNEVCEFATQLGLSLKESGVVTDKTYRLIAKLPSTWLKHVVGSSLMPDTLFTKRDHIPPRCARCSRSAP